MNKKNILIVGGAGYIGSHINKLLSSTGYNTIILDNLSTGHRDFVKWGAFELGDIGDSTRLDEVFTKYKIDCVMHFAAFAYVGESVENPEKYYQNNVTSTLNLLKSMRKHKVNKFIFSSSCATFGEPTKMPIIETTPQNPINPYGRTKLMIEHALKDYSDAYDMRFCALRYFNAAGCDRDSEVGEDHTPETHIIPLVLDAAIGKRESITIFGEDYPTEDGTCVRDYIHVEDLAEAHKLAMEYLLDGGESDVFNLGTGIGNSVKEIIEAVKKISKRNFTVKLGERRHGDPPVLVASSEKAKAILNWEAKYKDIEETIATAWQWHIKMNNINE